MEDLKTVEEGKSYYFFHRVGEALLSHRPLLILLITAVSSFAIMGVLRLDFDTDPRSIFQRSNADFDQLEQFFEDFGADDQDISLVLHGDNLFSPNFSKGLREFKTAAEQMSGVEKVKSILDTSIPGAPDKSLLPDPDGSKAEFESARKQALQFGAVVGQILSRDGRTMIVVVELDPEAKEVSKLRPLVDGVRALANEKFSGAGIEVSLSGHVAIRVDSLVGLQREFFQIMGYAAVISTLIALLLFRRPDRTLVVAAGPGFAVLWTLGLMGWIGLKIDGISTPLPTLVFVVAFANAVHLMVDIIRSGKKGEKPVDASISAISHLGLPCCLTSLTTAIGFGSLMLAQTESVQHFGLASACGSLLGLVANISIVPLLASFFVRTTTVSTKGRTGKSRSIFISAGNFLLRHAAIVTLVGVLLSAMFLVSATRLKADIKWTETLPADGETTRSMARCDQAFGGALQAYVVVDWDESIPSDDPRIVAVLQKIHGIIGEEPSLSGAMSILNFFQLPQTMSLPPESYMSALSYISPEDLRRLYRPDLRRAATSMHAPNIGAARLRPAFENLEKNLVSLEKDFPGFELHFTGTIVVASENITLIIRDLVWSLSMASIAAFLVLAISLRSLTLGLISVLPNAFPLLLNAGGLAFLDKPLQITSALTFSICLGIAIDDTIHFLMRYLRERKIGHGVFEAILIALESVGTALIITSLIIIGGFASAMTSEMPGLVLFGLLSCTALGAALVGDLIILPAMLMHFLGRKKSS